jgi:cell division protein FtsL
MSSVADAHRAAPPPNARARRAPIVAGGLVWIVLFGLLLSGVVAVNVAVLRLNLELDRSGHERAQLRADIAALRSQLSSEAATARIEKRAEQELGLVRADPDSTVFLRLEP